MLRDSAATFTERHGGAALRDMRGSETKINMDIWHQAAEAGWLAILAPESSGGLNLGITELCLVAEELGKGLVPEPVAAVAAVARALGDNADEIVDGDRVVPPALMEGPRAIGDEPPALTATADGEYLSLDGLKTGVATPADAGQFLVSASGADGIVLALVDADKTEIASGETIDGVHRVDHPERRESHAGCRLKRGYCPYRGPSRYTSYVECCRTAGRYGGCARHDGGIPENPRAVR